MPVTLCKPPIDGPSRWGHLLAAAGVLALGLSACTYRAPVRTISLTALESAPSKPITDAARLLVADTEALRKLCTPLGPRLGLVQVRNPQEWALLKRAVPQLGPCPDFNAGIVIGLACWAGTPVDGTWPVELESIQLRQGGGLLRARFEGGTYLPDGTARLETDYVKGLRAVLAVDINGTSFYPEQ